MDPRTCSRLLRTAGGVGLVVLAVGAGASPSRAQSAAADSAAAASARPVLSLRDCVAIALDGSLQIMVAETQSEIAAEDVKSAKGSFLPDISASATYQRSDRTDYNSPVYAAGSRGLVDTGGDTLYFATQVETGATEDVQDRSTYKNYGADASLTLFDGLANLNNLAAARAGLDAARLTQDYTRSQVIQNVGVAYYNLLRYLTLRDVKVEDRDRAAKELERTDTYFRLGSAARTDVLQQRVRLENTRLALVSAENAVEQAIADLSHAMNRPQAEPFDIDRSSLATDMQIEGLEALLAEAIASRTDLQASAATATARDKQAAAATGALLPQVVLFGSYGRTTNESPYRFGSQTSSSLSYGGRVSVPLFDRYQSWARRSQARAQARIAGYNLEQAQRDAQLEVRRLHISMVEAKERLQVSRETIAAAEEELRLAQERFRVGAGTQLDRITAEVSLAQARSDEVQAICDFLIARIQLYRALGRLDDLSQVRP